MTKKMAWGVFVVAATITLVACGNNAASSSSVTAAGSTASTPSGSTAAAAATPATGFGPTKTVEIVDPMFNMTAYTLSIPTSWDFEGTMLHGPGCGGSYTAIAYRAYSKDMLYGMQMIPSSSFNWSDDPRAITQGPSCKTLTPMSAEDYGRFVAIRMRPGAEVDRVIPAPGEPQFIASIEKNNQALAAQAASMGNRNPAKLKGEVKRIYIHYDLNGRAEEEALIVSMTVADQPKSVMVNKPGQVMQLAIKHELVSTATVIGIRAPKGQLVNNAPLEAIGGTMRANQDYIAKYNAWMQDMTNKQIAASWKVTNSILAAGAQAQAQRTANAQAFILNMQKEGDARNAQFAAGQAQKSAHAADVSDYLLDQQLYVNPTTGQTQTQSNQYNHTYSNGSGPGSAVVQSNAPANPQGVLQGNWTELQPIHH